MHFRRFRTVTVLAVAAVASLTLAQPAAAQRRVLYLDYVQPGAHNHPSRVNARAAMTSIAAIAGVTLTITEDAASLDAAALAQYDAFVFFTAGDLPASAPLRPALLNAVAGGKGFVGFHSSTDSFYSWPEWGDFIGARFYNHGSESQPGTIRVEDPDHVSMQGFANPFTFTEEFYLFSGPAFTPRASFTRRDLHVLMNLDPATPTPARPTTLPPPNPQLDASDLPLAWTRQHGAGRMFYSAFGHRPETWDNAQFRAHALAALRWALYDGDADGLDDRWEAKWGLRENDGTSVNGNLGDPDGDGRTNAQELVAGTHPRGFSQRFLAEGATSVFFQTLINVLNPSPTFASRVQLRYQLDSGVVTAADVTLAPLTRRTMLPPPESLFSTLIVSDAPVVADRTMTWSTASHYGSHAESALTAPAPNWFFAEGSTHSALDVFFLIQNPSDQPAEVDARFLRPAVGAPVSRHYTVGAHQRMTIQPDFIPGLEAVDLAAEFHSTNGTPIIVERAMYISRGGELWSGGTAGTGVTALGTNWFLAEGATGTFFKTYVLVANFNTSPAALTISFLRPFGQAPIVRQYTLPALGRLSLPVEDVDPALAGTSVSITVASTNGVPVVAERTMWWPGNDWYEGHSTLATNTTGTAWAVADALTGGADNSRTYLLVASGNSATDSLRVTVCRDAGPPLVRTFSDALAPNGRLTIDLGTWFPEVNAERVGVILESMGQSSSGAVTPMPIVVERAMYNDANGLFWAAGSNLVATKLR